MEGKQLQLMAWIRQGIFKFVLLLGVSVVLGMITRADVSNASGMRADGPSLQAENNEYSAPGNE